MSSDINATPESPDRRYIDGFGAAKYFKYFAQYKDERIIRPCRVERVPARGLYAKHQAIFDRLAKLFNKCQLDIPQYMEFFLLKYGMKDLDVELLLDKTIIHNFMFNLMAKEQCRKIYGYFVQSVDRIANDCVANDFVGVKDYLRWLIKTRRLASYVLGGRISQYYLAAIPNIKLIIEKLDPLSQEELRLLYERFDKYHVDVVEAYKIFKSIAPNPVKLVDDKIDELLRKRV